jgi:HlyD family secretion protein
LATVKKLLLVLVLIGIGLAGVAYWLSVRHAEAAEHIAYTTAPVEHGSLRDVVSATGVVQPREVFPVGTELSGKVVAVLADFNQRVAEGDVLARLDDRMAQARLRQAELTVEQARTAVKQAESARETARKVLDREKKRDPFVRREADIDLAEGHLRGAEVALDVARLKVREAEEARQQADLGLRLTVVRAPVLGAAEGSSSTTAGADRPGVGTVKENGQPSGRKRTFLVLDRKVALNQLVGPPASANLFTLASDLDRVQVVTQVVEGDINKVSVGMKARFTVSGVADGDQVFHGQVDDVHRVPVSDRGAVFYKVIIDAPNVRGPQPTSNAKGDWLLRPGLTASVDVIRRKHEAVWKLPTTALNFQPPASLESDAVRARLARQAELENSEQWHTVWTVGADHRPWPIFVRLGGTGTHGETGIQDSQFSEVLEWDPELRPAPNARDPASYPRVITGMPAPKKGGLFSMPNIKF